MVFIATFNMSRIQTRIVFSVIGTDCIGYGFGFMVFNATFNNIFAISWQLEKLIILINPNLRSLEKLIILINPNLRSLEKLIILINPNFIFVSIVLLSFISNRNLFSKYIIYYLNKLFQITTNGPGLTRLRGTVAWIHSWGEDMVMWNTWKSKEVVLTVIFFIIVCFDLISPVV
jgi:hypothetical protein